MHCTNTCTFHYTHSYACMPCPINCIAEVSGTVYLAMSYYVQGAKLVAALIIVLCSGARPSIGPDQF